MIIYIEALIYSGLMIIFGCTLWRYYIWSGGDTQLCFC